jgi:hypothetical protein
MSQLILKGHAGAVFRLNITQFRSPMSASISSVQTRRMMHHFPIRAGQPDIQFTAHFASLDEKHRFQNFVRDHQRHTQEVSYGPWNTDRGLVSLNWPERNIIGWTGHIVTLPVREPRFEYAPRVTFGVALVSSLMSTQTTNGSSGNSWISIIGQTIVPYIPFDPEVDIQPPIPPASQEPDPALEADPGAEEQRPGFLESVFNALRGVF